MQQLRLINNSSQLNMFREIILPIFRRTRLCVTAFGIMHPRCCRPEDVRCLKVKPRERAFKQFKSPVLNVLTYILLSDRMCRWTLTCIP